MLLSQDRQISMENIQKTVADFYKAGIGDLFVGDLIPKSSECNHEQG